jgi:hypothetical protein
MQHIPTIFINKISKLYNNDKIEVKKFFIFKKSQFDHISNGKDKLRKEMNIKLRLTIWISIRIHWCNIENEIFLRFEKIIHDFFIINVQWNLLLGEEWSG